MPPTKLCKHVLQSISFRDAFYHSIMANQPGLRLEEIMCDIVHPNALGHRSVDILCKFVNAGNVMQWITV